MYKCDGFIRKEKFDFNSTQISTKFNVSKEITII